MTDIPKVSSERQSKAKKNYKCCECHKPINVGDSYLRYSGVWNNEWENYRFHIYCYQAYVTQSIECYDPLAFGEWFEYYWELPRGELKE